MDLKCLCTGLSLPLGGLSGTLTTAPLLAKHWKQNKNKWNFRNRVTEFKAKVRQSLSDRMEVDIDIIIIIIIISTH